MLQVLLLLLILLPGGHFWCKFRIHQLFRHRRVLNDEVVAAVLGVGKVVRKLLSGIVSRLPRIGDEDRGLELETGRQHPPQLRHRRHERPGLVVAVILTHFLQATLVQVVEPVMRERQLLVLVEHEADSSRVVPVRIFQRRCCVEFMFGALLRTKKQC